MRTHEAYIHFLIDEKDDCHNPVVVALYVEHIAVIAHIVHRVERPPDVSEIAPISPGNSLVPFFQRLVRVSMYGYKITNGGKLYNSHNRQSCKKILMR